MIDQYGTKINNLDYGVGTDKFAVRLAFVNGTQDYDRVNIGGQLSGYYGQFLFQLPLKTTLRVTTEGTTYNRINSAGPADSANRSGPATHAMEFPSPTFSLLGKPERRIPRQAQPTSQVQSTTGSLTGATCTPSRDGKRVN